MIIVTKFGITQSNLQSINIMLQNFNHLLAFVRHLKLCTIYYKLKINCSLGNLEYSYKHLYDEIYKGVL